MAEKSKKARLQTYKINETKEVYMANTIIFDLDGTLANIDARRDMAIGVDGKMNWDVFFHPSHISFDKPNPQVIKSAQLFKDSGFRIFIFSGRNDRSFHATKQWLKAHKVPFDLLVMRPDKFKDESWPVAHGNKATPKMRGMPDEVLKRLPACVILTNEHCFLRKDAELFASRLLAHDKLLDYCVRPGISHYSDIAAVYSDKSSIFSQVLQTYL